MANRIAILGAGSWGTALALQAAKNGHRVMLWGHERTHIDALANARSNQQFLPGFELPASIELTNDLSEAIAFGKLQMLAVPSHAFKATLIRLASLAPDLKIAWATKGFEPTDGALLHQVVADIFSSSTPAAILSGPTFAREVAMELPTAVTVASIQSDFAQEVSAIFHNDRFRAYTSQDIVGVEVGGAVKNVLAIAAGIADGLGFGANTRAALITRGLSEITRLGVKLGGKAETLIGLAGMGDLVLTCTDNQSRNRRFGLGLGEGREKAQLLSNIAQEVEGISAARETYHLACKLGVDMPITEQTYKVLYENQAPLAAVKNLLARDQKAEN
jgi:glycerol-3-phosphate dehydrogenase (NAD(P)+)